MLMCRLFLCTSNSRCIQQLWVSLPERRTNAHQVQQQWRTWVPLLANGGRCSCELGVSSCCWFHQHNINDCRKNNTWFFPSFYHLIQNGKFSPRSPEQGNGGGSGYCCVYLPDGSASLAPTRKGQLIKDMLSSLCEKRGFPLKDIVIYLHGKEKVGARLLRAHRCHRAEVLWIFKQTLVSFSILLQQPLSLDQDCSVLRDQQVTLELRVKFVWVNTSFLFILWSLSPQQAPPPTSSIQHVLCDDMQGWTCQNWVSCRNIVESQLFLFTSGLKGDVKIALTQWG